MSKRERRITVRGHVGLDLIPTIQDGRAMALEPGALVEVGRAVLPTGGAVANTGLDLDTQENAHDP